MRWRFLFFISLAVNLALAALWLGSARRTAVLRKGSAAAAGGATAPIVRTNVVLRRQFLSWATIESADYPTYIRNLRDIGCPEQTIRDIIIADVNALYAHRRALEITNAAQQWWRSEPDPEVIKTAAEKSRALDDERRALLTSLLGPGWEGGDLASLPRPSRQGVPLDGPVLGVLPDDTKKAVEDMSARAAERLQAYLDAQQAAGKSPDPAELARLRAQTRAELAGVLSPPQLEEYLLRYSQTANDLRAQLGQLKYLNATPDEFRAMFDAADPIDQQIQALGNSDDPAIVAQRNQLLQQREAAIKFAIGPDRYQQYQLLQDPLYRQAYAAALQSGDPGAAQDIYAINLTAMTEQNQIQSSTNLTDTQRALALKQLELDQLRATAEATGQEPPQPPQPPPPAPAFAPRVVQPGDTLNTIAAQYNLPVATLRLANPNVDWKAIRPGDTVRIPQHVTTPANAVPPP